MGRVDILLELPRLVIGPESATAKNSEEKNNTTKHARAHMFMLPIIILLITPLRHLFS